MTPRDWLLFGLALLGPAVPRSVGATALQCPDGTPPPCRPRPVARIPIAVLYFDNLSSDTADAWLADGLTEEVTDRMSGLDRLEVRSRNSVRRMQRAGASDPLLLGRALNVRYVVEGSLRASGRHLRISVRLTRTTDGTQLWTQVYNRSRADLLDLQEDIALQAASRIVGSLLPPERARFVERPTRRPPAYDRFVLGNYFLRQRTPASLARAIREYQAALRLDTAFPAARARIALAYSLGLGYGMAPPFGPAPAESLRAAGMAQADQALRLDPRSSDGWMARGQLLEDPEASARAFVRAMALDASNAEAYHLAGANYRILGADSAAVRSFRQALALEPDRAITLHGLGFLYLLTRDYATARRWLDSAIAVDSALAPTWLRRSAVRLAQGEPIGALADARRSTALGLADPAWNAIVAAATGDTTEARALLDGPGDAWARAGLLVALGRHGEALDALEAVRPRDIGLWSALRLPNLDPIRGDPRFQRLVEETRPRRRP